MTPSISTLFVFSPVGRRAAGRLFFSFFSSSRVHRAPPSRSGIFSPCAQGGPAECRNRECEGGAEGAICQWRRRRWRRRGSEGAIELDKPRVVIGVGSRCLSLFVEIRRRRQRQLGYAPSGTSARCTPSIARRRCNRDRCGPRRDTRGDQAIARAGIASGGGGA